MSDRRSEPIILKNILVSDRQLLTNYLLSDHRSDANIIFWLINLIN